MKRIVASRRFQKHLDDLPADRLEKTLETIEAFRVAIHEGLLPKGLGLKKISRNKYEIRVDLKTRIGIMEDGEIFVLDLIGNHEDIKNFLRNY